MDAYSTGSPEEIADIDRLEAFSLENKIPITHQSDLTCSSSKAVVCMSFEPNGNRFVTGSLDYTVKMFDFGGMDCRHKYFRSIEPQNGYPVVSVSHSPTGDRFVIATGSSQPIVYDREGKEIIKFCKGDMYIRDLTNTKGHTMELTGVQWHPIEKNIILTCSLDGSLRLWDLLGEAHFGNLMSKVVMKVRASGPGAGQGRLGVTSCCFSPTGQRIVGGTTDGSIHIWSNKPNQYSRADIVLKHAVPDSLSAPSPVTCVTIATLGFLGVHKMAGEELLLATRRGNTVNLWDLKKHQKPMFVLPNMPSEYPTSNVDFSPDGSVLVCGCDHPEAGKAAKMLGPSRISSSSSSSEKDAGASAGVVTNPNSLLCFFDIKSAVQSAKEAVAASRSTPGSGGKSDTVVLSPSMQIGVDGKGAVIMVNWQPKLNQIFCSTSAGFVRVYFDPRISQKGAVVTAGKAAKREMSTSDFASSVGEIYNPHALPLFRTEPLHKRKAGGRDGNSGRIATASEKPADSGPKKRENSNFFFTQFIMKDRKVDNMRTEDPREALLKMDAKAKADPMFLGRAYEGSQPVTQLYAQTLEEEQEEFKKRQKRVI